MGANVAGRQSEKGTRECMNNLGGMCREGREDLKRTLKDIDM